MELSQKYLTDALGEDWQDEYYIWDCAAGTGNLLTGLTNKYNVWASTLDRQDVDVMKDRIKNGANLLEDHVFQFDFLNDEFDKLPAGLQSIVNDPEKRKKLVMYINPPYAESNGKVSTSRSKIQETRIYQKYYSKLEKVGAELFAQFLMRIYIEIPDCVIGQFSTLKVVSASNSKIFRNNYLAKFEKCFIVPANTFDNVKGSFPIGFLLWNTKEKERIQEISADIYNVDGEYCGKKQFYSYDNLNKRINDWLNNYKIKKEIKNIGYLMADAPDFQNNNYVALQNNKGNRHGIFISLSSNNIKHISIYFSVRHCIEATWLNDRDQFLYPNDGWSTDAEFQNDCLAFALFHGQNKISSKEGTNHWIPFTEQEVDAREKFESNFMTQYIKGKLGKDEKNGGKDVLHLADVGHLNEMELFQSETNSFQCRTTPLEFSPEALEVFDCGRKLWRYYHKCIKIKNMKNESASVNASLYDIREYFQGRNDKGKMNNKSDDTEYMELIKDIRESLKLLAKKIEPKVYEYGFLKA